MKRGYTVEQYLEMHDRIREIMPDCAVSSDFIVGHPGETEAEFEKSIDLVRRCRFKNSFIFKYSPRPGTKAFEHYPDDIPEDVKRRRNNALLAIQNEISEEDNAPLSAAKSKCWSRGRAKRPANSDAEPAPNGPIQLVGRSTCDRIVVFDGNPRLAGTLAQIAVSRLHGHDADRLDRHARAAARLGFAVADPGLGLTHPAGSGVMSTSSM